MYKKRQRILIIGGNDAGLAAAGKAKRINPDAEVTVIEKSPHFGYASCSLPFYLANQLSADKVSGYDVQSVKQKRGYDVLLSSSVKEVSLVKRTVLVENLTSGSVDSYQYDKLIFATGAVPVIPSVFPENAANMFTVRNFADAEHLNSFLNKQPRKAVIVGSGYLGLEIAEALLNRGLQVTVIEQKDSILDGFSKEIADNIFEHLKNSGINILLNKKIVNAAIQNNSVRQLNFEDQQQVECDVLILAAGMQPNTELAKKAGIPMGPGGAIIVNKNQETKRMNVYAAGDCCETTNIVTSQNQWIPFAGVAARQGRVAGGNAAGERSIFNGSVATSMVRLFDMEVGKTGLSFNQAKDSGFSPEQVTITQNARPPFIGNTDSKTTLTLVYDKKSNKVLGAQICGKVEAAQRINILATAVTAKMTVNDLAQLDLGYTPAVNNMWDPIHIAASVASR